MKLAILETGRPPGDLAARFGDYPAMFERMLGDGFDIRTFDVGAGELPADPGEHDAHLITGSPAGVYDDLPWIAELCEFIRAAKASRMNQVSTKNARPWPMSNPATDRLWMPSSPSYLPSASRLPMR